MSDIYQIPTTRLISGSYRVLDCWGQIWHELMRNALTNIIDLHGIFPNHEILGSYQIATGYPFSVMAPSSIVWASIRLAEATERQGREPNNIYKVPGVALFTNTQTSKSLNVTCLDKRFMVPADRKLRELPQNGRLVIISRDEIYEDEVPHSTGYALLKSDL